MEMEFTVDLQAELPELIVKRDRLRIELNEVEQAIDGFEAYMRLRGESVALTNGKTWQSIRSAVDEVLRGDGSKWEWHALKQRIESIEPPVDVKNMDSALSATLSRGVKNGRYARPMRGVYQWAAFEVPMK